MFEKNDKRKLYWLIDQFLIGKINSRTFCKQYYECYDLELNTDLLTKLEKNAFSSLSEVVNRFSEFKEDLSKYPRAFFNEEQLFDKVRKTKKLLVVNGMYHSLTKAAIGMDDSG